MSDARLVASCDDALSAHERYPEWMILAGAVFLVTLLFAINVFLRPHTYVSSPQRLSTALVARVGRTPDWTVWGEHLAQPFPNRVLFRLLFVGVAQVLALDTVGIWIEFIVFNYLLSVAQALLLYVYCVHVLRLSRVTAALSVALVQLSFTHVFAFEHPVYVIEDVLAYVILLGGLIALSSRKTLLFQVCLVAGVLTRETLLVLLLVYWLYSDDALLRKSRNSIPALVALALPRLLLGNMVYNPLSVSLAVNLQRPVEALVLVFATFGVLWFVVPFAWSAQQSLTNTPLNRTIGVLAIGSILIASLIGGRLRETRLVFLAFPWIVVPSAEYLAARLDRLLQRDSLEGALRLAVPGLGVLALTLVAILFLGNRVRYPVSSVPLSMIAYVVGSAALSVMFLARQWEAGRYG